MCPAPLQVTGVIAMILEKLSGSGITHEGMQGAEWCALVKSELLSVAVEGIVSTTTTVNGVTVTRPSTTRTLLNIEALNGLS